MEIEAGKIQAPPLRDETLRRDRLLDWLDAKIHHRLILVIAEAGYGKTTLLADFSHRTRLRTLWYRLDETDADWVTVLRHLVAAGRQVDPAFASTTWSLLEELGTGGTTMAAIVATFIRELQSLGDTGAVLVLDDYHLVEGVPELEWIVREIVHSAPERLSVVLLSRHRPTLPVARLRALGEVAELGRDELRFSAAETEQLFREKYGRPLDADIVAELGERTQGWAASLQLVRTALRDPSMSETRAFVRSLTGARGTIHDFLAEEVVGDLDPALQSFLMRTSILSVLNETTSAVSAGIDPVDARGHLDTATRLGLLARADSMGGGYRYHPLVRDFLEDRLRREIRAEGILELHRVVARFGEATDWRLAAHHYTAAGDLADLHRVLVSAIRDIMSGGDFALAESYVRRFPDLESDPTLGLFLSRRDAYNGDFASAVARAQGAVDANPPSSGTHLSHLALANLATISMTAIDTAAAVRVAGQLAALKPVPALEVIARATIAIGRASVDGDLDEAARVLEEALTTHGSRGHGHYQGITFLNRANNFLAKGMPDAALASADAARELLESSSAGPEVDSLVGPRGWSLMHKGEVREAREALRQSLSVTSPVRPEVLVEAADVFSAYDDPEEAHLLLREAGSTQRQGDYVDLARLVWADWKSRNGRADEALDDLANMNPDIERAVTAFSGRLHLARARASLLAGASVHPSIDMAIERLEAQHAGHWLRCALVIRAVADSTDDTIGLEVRAAIGGDRAYLTVCANELAPRLGALDQATLALVRDETHKRPSRWLPPLRQLLRRGAPSSSALVAAQLIDEFGEQPDIALLRGYARETRTAAASRLGRGLARRLAPRAQIDDLGHVQVEVGPRRIDGSAMRRKVLSLICLLLTKPNFAATRDQVLEALWPDFEPSVAVNSLNQTVYFARRVFEPQYREDESADYMQHDGEVVRLDTDLVTSQSSVCRALADRARAELDADLVDQLATVYTGHFAIDFEYEDWASPYRETLHAAFLGVIEQSARAEFNRGNLERAGRLARRALEIDPDSEPLEAMLLRIYRGAGSHAAAAEQRSHYAAVNGDDDG